MPYGSYQNGLGAQPRGKMGTHGDGKPRFIHTKADELWDPQARHAMPEVHLVTTAIPPVGCSSSGCPPQPWEVRPDSNGAHCDHRLQGTDMNEEKKYPYADRYERPDYSYKVAAPPMHPYTPPA